MNSGYVTKNKAERACKPCRDLKVRCLPCAERDDICQKCKRSGARCIFEEAKTRKRRKTASCVNTVTALQAQVAELIAKLEGTVPPSEDDLDAQMTWGPGYTSPRRSLHDLSHSRDCNGLDGARQAGGVHGIRVVDRLIENGVLARNQAVSLLSTYRKMCAHSPFVPIPEDATLEGLAETQPFTLNAVLVVSSGESDKDVQRTLEKSFRDQLLRTVVVEGERSIDLLQALIVYLSWYHFFYIPIKQQFYQTLQITISICIDLKLDRPPENPVIGTRGRAGSRSSGDHLPFESATDQFHGRAARRAYVGCYCISAITSWTWCKPNNVRRTEYLMRCARSLTDEPEYASDNLILPLLEAYAFGDTQHYAVLTSQLDHAKSVGWSQMQSKLSSFGDELKDVDTPGESACVTLDLAVTHALSYGDEMNLLNPCNGPPSSESEAMLPLTTGRRECLSLCSRSAADAFQTFLSLPLEQYPNLSILQWWALICNTAYLYRLSFGIPQIPEWDAKAGRDAIKLETFLDLLCYRLEHSTRSTLEQPSGRDLYSLLCPIFTNVKRSYERLKKLSKPLRTNDAQTVHTSAFVEGPQQRNSTGAASKSATHQSRCPAFRCVSRTTDIDLDPSPVLDNVNASEPPEVSDIDKFLNSDLFEGGDSTWLEEMPPLALSSVNLDNVNFISS